MFFTNLAFITTFLIKFAVVHAKHVLAQVLNAHHAMLMIQIDWMIRRIHFLVPAKWVGLMKELLNVQVSELKKIFFQECNKKC